LGSGIGGLEPTYAPVVRVELPADEAGRLEPVDVMRDRGALEMDVRRERGLADAADVPEGAQDDPCPERAAGGRERVFERLAHRLRGEDELPAQRLDERHRRGHHFVRY